MVGYLFPLTNLCRDSDISDVYRIYSIKCQLHKIKILLNSL